jgi:hypothetical protein
MEGLTTIALVEGMNFMKIVAWIFVMDVCMVNTGIVHVSVNNHFTSCVKPSKCKSFTFYTPNFSYLWLHFMPCGSNHINRSHTRPLKLVFFTICFQDIFGIFSIYHFKEFKKSFVNIIMLNYVL